MKFLVILFGVFILSTPAFAQETDSAILGGQIDILTALSISCSDPEMVFPDIVAGVEDTVVADAGENGSAIAESYTTAKPATCEVEGQANAEYTISFTNGSFLLEAGNDAPVVLALATADVGGMGPGRALDGNGDGTILVKGTMTDITVVAAANDKEDANVGTITVAYD